MVVAAISRFIECDGAFNVRDLGGYVSDDGRTTRWRAVFRADGLHRASDALRVARDLDLRTVLDLRSIAEVEAAQYRCDGVDVVHLPMLATVWNASEPVMALASTGSPVDFLVRRYIAMCEEGAEAIATAFELLASQRRRPAVFHCAAGKDRTGVLAALLLGALGVDDDQIAEDYHLSGRAMEQLVAWMARNRPEVAEHMTSQPPAFLACPPLAIIRLLKHLRAQHGAVHLYLADIGVDSETIESLRDQLLED